MSLIRVYKSSGKVKALTVDRLKRAFPNVVSVRYETCYYIDSSKRIPKWDDLEELEMMLGGNLRNILGDQWTNCLYHDSRLRIQDPSETIIEIGPRLNFTTAWSTNAVSICHSSGLDSIKRMEQAKRYWIKASVEISREIHRELVKVLHDAMTEQEYPVPLKTFEIAYEAEPWTQIDVIGRGTKALEEANMNLGLAFDDWDIEYYTNMFQSKVQRNPTTVELFDLAQSNSEHSRHWFFKGDYYVDGEKMPQSMFDMVMATNKHPNTNQNNVIAFSDNSSGITGWTTPMLVTKNPLQASRFLVKPKTRHLIYTAETHNFPTGVAPFSGAATGTGGRIRDIQSAGRGGHVVAATAGYCFGNLHIPGYNLPWEFEAEYPPNFASPLDVAIEASNGASDYGNKFGEPVIAGFARSFGLFVGAGYKRERREWIKPIMFSGGMGTIDDGMISKLPPKKGYLVTKLGGPAYRIGVGGGAASSVQVQGDNMTMRDLGAVQRGDAEMEQKLNRVIRGCIEMERNPILSLHDQGAGGNANVLKELIEGSGGEIYTKSFSVGDPTLSTLEIWGAEYQESNALLTRHEQLNDLERLAKRERCPMDVVGVVTDDKKVRLIEEEMDVTLSDSPRIPSHKMNPVDLQLDFVLGNSMPKKKFNWTKERVEIAPLAFPEQLTVWDALQRVLRLPSVGSKRYLTNKVDRSVTGLVAQQQCVGPLHTPLSDVAVTALSYFGKEGTATSIGEQPIKTLVNPAAGARMSVLEALANLASAPITDLKDVKCSANWMWPAKLPGEGWTIYEACKSMCDIMKIIGVAVDGGKDSLSMAARVKDSSGSSSVVKSPGSLVISAYAPCTDITKVVTPDLKGPAMGAATSLLWIRPVPAHARLAGTALAQAYSQLGQSPPDVFPLETMAFVNAFNVIQELLKEEMILSLHDISDGGLITCLVEMGIAGWGGFTVDIPPGPAPPHSCTDDLPRLLASVFCEEVGWVMEVHPSKVEEIVHRFHSEGVPGTCPIGITNGRGQEAQMKLHVDGVLQLDSTVLEVASIWEETSFKLEQRQMNPDCAVSEYQCLAKRNHTKYRIPFSYKDLDLAITERYLSEARVAVIREEGTNGDREMAAALLCAGFTVYDVTMTDIFSGRVKIDNYRGLIFPGGFSYADVLGSGVGWAASIKGREDFRKNLEAWKERSNTFSLSICNGCQLVALLGWLNPEDHPTEVPMVKLKENVSGRFESRWSHVRIESNRSILLKDMEGARLGIWVAHGEGRFVYQQEYVRQALERAACIAMRYVDDFGEPTEEYPMNPNGSEGGVAGITSSCGRHLALMPHPERCFMRWQWPLAIDSMSSAYKEKMVAPWIKLFQNGFDWCIETKN